MLALLVGLTTIVMLQSNHRVNAIQSNEFDSAIAQDSFLTDEISRSSNWHYEQPSIAEPILLGHVHPIVWGLLILLATLYCALALTKDWSTSERY